MRGCHNTVILTEQATDTIAIKDHLLEILRVALDAVLIEKKSPSCFSGSIQLERTRSSAHGDFATNLALQLAGPLKSNPREIATHLCQKLPASKYIHKVEIAGPGFINFYTTQDNGRKLIETVLLEGARYGCAKTNNTRVQIEFVSANPTGPLHVGHGRGAAYGSCLANILKACGYDVACEYYINDAGRQIDILALSLWLSYLHACGEAVVMPDNMYRGQYVGEYAQLLLSKRGKKWHLKNLKWPIQNTSATQDSAEQHLDACIEYAKLQLGTNAFKEIKQFVAKGVIEDIRKELEKFRVVYDVWYAESDLLPDKANLVIDRLKKSGHTDERDGNLWFLSTHFGDDKDRVLRRKNGTLTYFASDIAYHLDKFERGFDHIINVWGADHHGYIARIHAALQALGHESKRLEISLVQMMSLRNGCEKTTMSTRTGQFIHLSTLREEIGVDATRFFYIMRRVDQSSDFDLDLAKTKSKDNPVYYIQYAHARLCSMQRQMHANKLEWNQSTAMDVLHVLDKPEELKLLRKISDYPELIQRAGSERTPHLLANFLNDLAGNFHLCYDRHRILVEDETLRNARVALALAVKQVIANGLTLLGLSTPERM